MRQNKKAPYFAQICRPYLRSVPMRKRDIHGSTPPFLLSPWVPLGTEVSCCASRKWPSTQAISTPPAQKLTQAPQRRLALTNSLRRTDTKHNLGCMVSTYCRPIEDLGP
ncbi:hypothetical protein CGMCC3_g17116 [Colletotrichum fructicola]|nr:uncharacterized protein CGMCC3_g17116 [Colletotrichum fructicola]KAE9566720.1 hypothetical protein CGMCC3_g17116 [Colletotrichum fructicola]